MTGFNILLSCRKFLHVRIHERIHMGYLTMAIGRTKVKLPAFAQKDHIRTMEEDQVMV